MAIEVFNRYENKYMIDDDTRTAIQRRLTEHMDTDYYNQTRDTYSICNLYYDTDDSHLIRESLSKPRYKEKLRLRSYGTPKLTSKAYAEIKKKCFGLVNKRRSAMRLSEAYDFLSAGSVALTPEMNPQVVSEIAYMLSQRPLFPKLYLAYERRAYFGIAQRDLRISFDTAIVTRRRDLRLESGIYGDLLLPRDMWLMEIKVANNMPLWLTKLLSELKVYPASFSKYGRTYMNELAGLTNDFLMIA
ncbi:molecular chaperone [Clostridia bacterium]|nr:molecular chaperone [Clostridia bacterium]